jgi:hypothetical protein
MRFCSGLDRVCSTRRACARRGFVLSYAISTWWKRACYGLCAPRRLGSETWQTRSNQLYTRYALGAMQEVGPQYTRISLETAERVGKQLANSINNLDFRLQGSVPLNVHIRGVSDVDLLTVDTSLLVYDPEGAAGQRGGYSSTTKTSLGVLLELRSNVEQVLPMSFPAAKIDKTGGRAVSISGGSLARTVDVVPSHWYDSSNYQLYGQAHDRGVCILNRKVPETIKNWPFLPIKLIGDRCDSALGGLRKAIRLCKNVKADTVAEGTDIAFPSFDIAATMYHSDMEALQMGAFYELRILAETQRFLDVLYQNESYAKTLQVPDGSRIIFDTQAKYDAMKKLSVEMDDLVKEVAKEQSPTLQTQSDYVLKPSRDAIWSVQVPN